MTTFEALPFQQHFYQLGPGFYTEVKPQGLEQAYLLSASSKAAQLIGLDPAALHEPDFVAIASGNRIPEKLRPLAMVYAGHQFGGYSPQLGDGRALLLGEVESENGLIDVVIKGAGQTPYSRFGDGRAVLRSSIREYLCSEAMHGLGIPTTRALAVCGSREAVYRERTEPGATLIRLAESHIRFGSFEYFFYRKQLPQLQQLTDYTIKRHFPHLLSREDKYPAFLLEVIESTARLIAQWQAFGFCHGVMNTDNMSILGITLDYGPFAFMDDFDPGYICNHSDHGGRYAYDKQPHIGLWNLNALAHALSPLVDTSLLPELLARYEPALVNHYASLMRQKLGFEKDREEDQQLLADLLALMTEYRVDYTRFFRQLCSASSSKANAELASLFDHSEGFLAWEKAWQARLQFETRSDSERQQAMRTVNPKYILRNYMAENAIRLAEQEADFSEVNRLLQLLYHPYDEQPENEHYASEPPAWGKCMEISCSS